MYKPDEALKQSIDQWIEANQNDFVRDLAKLVAIPSISVENDGPWPFGEECKNVLDKAAEIAGEYGFTVVNHEYHCGSCVVPGTGEHPKRIGMFAHLDVVPLGDGWQYPPLGCTLKDGFLIGRGVGDNKGPAICALYALRFLKEHKIELKNDVMIYFGLSEETGLKDIEYFCKTQQIPDLCLVTDTNFPICYGEKGLLRAELNLRTDGNLIDFHAGSVVNVIPSKAEVLLSDVSLEEVKRQLGDQEALTAEADGPHVRITATGISRHAAFPEGAVNAVQVLAAALSGTTLLQGSCADAVKGLAELTSDFYGAGADISFEDEASGKLTAVGSVVRMEAGNMKEADIISTVKNGIFVDTFTNGQVQIGAGDFTFFVKSGYLIEDGKLTQPIKDINIIGNGPKALADITMVADNDKIDNGTWTCGKDGQSCPVTCGMPSALVSKLTVGGES